MVPFSARVPGGMAVKTGTAVLAAVAMFATIGWWSPGRSPPEDAADASLPTRETKSPAADAARPSGVPDLVAHGAQDAATLATRDVTLRWRVSGLRHTRDASGNEHGSIELELIVEGGEPARVRLGRRRAYGFVPAPLEPGQIASVQSYVEAHGEYAEVTRPCPRELLVEAYGQDEALPGFDPPRSNVRRAIVHISADAGVQVDETVEEVDRDD